MYKLYEIMVVYENENQGLDSFTYMDIFNSEENNEEILLDKHSRDYIIADIVFREILFEEYTIDIVKKSVNEQ